MHVWCMHASILCLPFPALPWRRGRLQPSKIMAGLLLPWLPVILLLASKPDAADFDAEFCCVAPPRCGGTAANALPQPEWANSAEGPRQLESQFRQTIAKWLQ
jgi:hypothetical protein